MTAKFRSPYRSFASALRQVVEENLTTVKVLCEVGRVSDQTIRNWMRDDGRVDEDTAHYIAINHHNPSVRRILSEARCSGGEFSAASEVGETDVDGDGRTTVRDALLSFSQLTKSAAAELDLLLTESADGLNDAEIQRAMNGLSQLKHQIARTIGAIEKATSGRRHAIRYTGNG